MATLGTGRPRVEPPKGRRKRKSTFRAERSNFREEFIGIARRLVGKEFKTDAQVAAILGVGTRTLERWKLEIPRLARAMKRGEEDQIKAIEQAQMAAAQGYTHHETKAFAYKGRIITKQVEVHTPPSTAAAKLILAAKKPEVYGDRLEISGSATKPVEFRMIGRYDKDDPKDEKA